MESLPTLAIYAVVLTLLFKKRASPVVYGMQLGLGAAVTCLSLGTFVWVLPGFAVLDDYASVLAKLFLAGLLNFLMTLSAVISRSDLAVDEFVPSILQLMESGRHLEARKASRRARMKFFSTFLIVFIIVSAYVFLSWWRPFAVSE